jgi:hypothetical protein
MWAETVRLGLAIVGLVVIAYELWALLRRRGAGVPQGVAGNRQLGLGAARRWSLLIGAISLPPFLVSGFIGAPIVLTLFFAGTCLGCGVIYVLLSAAQGVADGLSARRKGKKP